jgi:hypothetical protein
MRHLYVWLVLHGRILHCNVLARQLQHCHRPLRPVSVHHMPGRLMVLGRRCADCLSGWHLLVHCGRAGHLYLPAVPCRGVLRDLRSHCTHALRWRQLFRGQGRYLCQHLCGVSRRPVLHWRRRAHRVSSGLVLRSRRVSASSVPCWHVFKRHQRAVGRHMRAMPCRLVLHRRHRHHSLCCRQLLRDQRR